MSALGKGLGSLIPSRSMKSTVIRDHSFDPQDFDTRKIHYVSLDKIASNPWQPRTSFDREKLEELAESIKKHGILQPLVVTKGSESDSYQLIAGERRLKAAEILGLSEVPVIYREASDRDKLEMSVVENIQRHDLSPVEEALSFKRLQEEFGLSHEDIGKHVGKAAGTVGFYLRLLELPIVIKEALEKGEINLTHARLILSLATKTEQTDLFKKIIKNKLDATDAKDEAKRRAEKALARAPQDPILTSWEDKLSKSLGAKTTISKHNEKGFIKINFFSHAELKDILDKLT